MNNILLILNFIFVAIIFMFLRDVIKKRLKIIVAEKFDIKKLTDGLFSIKDKVKWSRDISQIFNVRKLLIYSVIIASIYAYGNFKGTQGKPVEFNLDYEKEFSLQVDTNLYLHKPKNSRNLEMIDEKGNHLKKITVADIPELKKKLKPISMELVPVIIGGFGSGAYKSGFEVGGGVSFLRYWKWRLETFITSNPALYLGTSYKITDNSGIGIGTGKGIYGENRAILYYRGEF